MHASVLKIKNGPTINASRCNTFFAMFSGKVSLRPAEVKRGERLYLIARVVPSRSVLLEAAGVYV